MKVAIVPLPRAEALRDELHRRDLVDRSVRMVKRGGELLIPLREVPRVDLAAFGARLEDVAGLAPRPVRGSPRALLEDRLAGLGMPRGLAPRHWERLGDVIVLRLNEGMRRHAATLARALGETLGARTVVEDVSGIHGPFREPDVRILWGDGTETVHVEDGIRFKLDVARVMFSSGNLGERMAIARRIRPGQVVVDLFAGIGYFAVPIGVRADAAIVHACEVNPAAYGYLVENIRMNRASKVKPAFGDCRDTAPRGIADWVLMGHFEAARYLDVAFGALGPEGTIVYHERSPRDSFPRTAMRRISSEAEAFGRAIVGAESRVVKSYAPGIVHGVIEARVVDRAGSAR